MKVFLDDLHRWQVLEQVLLKKYNTISTWRLIIFLAGIAGTGWAIKSADASYAYPALICFFLFFLLLIYHSRVQDQLNRTQCLIRINQNYLARSNGDWVNFEDSGLDFVDPEHSYSSDLDIIGSHSLFQMICTAHTFYGRHCLAQLLIDPPKDVDAIQARQRAVKEIVGKVDFAREFECAGKLKQASIQSPEKLVAYAQDQVNFFKYEWIKWVFVLLPAVTILSIVLTAMNFSLPAYIPVVLVFLQMGIYLAYGKKIQTILFAIYTLKSSLDTYRRLLTLIAQEDFLNRHLLALKQDLFAGTTSALLGLERLDYITGATELKSNPIIYFLANIVLFWDFHTIFALEAWKKLYGARIESWLKVIGEFEAYISLAVVAHLDSEYCWPDFDDDMKFMAQDLGHPLIIPEKMVCNSIDINRNIGLITGSNMSGKTTLLRTIGINLVLAYAGAPVIAKTLHCSIMNIFTSMRIQDDLNSGISTFYAELLRIKTIVEFALLEEPMIFLMDEIFRGTNSQDRLIGAQSVILSLNKPWIIGLVSTHDLELCDLENDTRVKMSNYHFTEHYVNDEIHFDYKLRQGRCNSSNAKHLMKLAGIVIQE